MHINRDHDPASRCLRLQPRGDVHTITIEIVAIDDQVAEVQAESEHNGCLLGFVPVGLDHSLLELDCRPKGVHCTGKLGQSAVSGQLDQPAAVARQCRLEPLLAVLPQARQGAALVPPHQSGIADHIGRNDCR